ncbi:TniQ family protein [Caballeronia sp. J97]|uniref:TnsD family Tn7-like transposition protein n=1 Tax=Caballeronia sp. J97 TaxID=2805429 RepID=UPI0039EF2D60
MFFPKPYPDELLGSLLIRSSRRLGLSLRTMVQFAGLVPPEYPSFIVPGNLSRIADYTATPAAELLEKHTLFAFVCLTYDSSEIAILRCAAIHGDGIQSSSAYRAQFTNRSRRVSFRRYCSACAAEDERVFGEAYWHRMHAVPGVLTCPEHNSRLLETSAYLLDGLRNETVFLPNETCASRPWFYASKPVLRLLSVLASDALKLEPGSWRDCADAYVAALRAAGYEDLRDRETRRRLIIDCKEFFDARFLDAFDLSLAQPAATTWLMRVTSGERLHRQSTLSHLFLRCFLEAAKTLPS